MPSEPRPVAEPPACPLCGSQGRFALAEPDRYLGVNPGQVHPLYSCVACGHYFQPIVPVEELLPYYPPRYYGEDQGAAMPGVLARLRLNRRARSVEWRAAKGRVIDVGCGRGNLLQELKSRGWSVVGMDWNAGNADVVAGRLGIPVVAGPKGLDGLAAGSFDAVSLFHVLEHEQQPLLLLEQVHRLLKRNGRVLIGVPSGGSTASRLFGRHWMGYDFPRHRQVFTPRSLTDALVRKGFVLERMTGRFSDEMLDVYRSSALMLADRGVRSRLAVAGTAVCMAAIVIVARLFGRPSVIYAYARKQ